MSTAAKPAFKTLNSRLSEEFAKLFRGSHAEASTIEAPTSVRAGLEAIVIEDHFQRPALLVRNNTFQQPQSSTWRAILAAQRSKIDAGIRSVGRLEMTGHPTLPFAGTAWMIADGVAVTNRHVASIFARKQGAQFSFRNSPIGGKFTARIDFREESNIPTSMEIAVEKILFIADDGDGSPDVALLKLRGARLPDPIELFDGRLQAGQQVAVIGYPADDPRNPSSAIADIFGHVFNVKRLAPGEIMANPRGSVLHHDCSTLGGNSGSVVLDIETGKAVGLHFGGRFRENNMAVEAKELKRILGSLQVRVSVPPMPERPAAAAAEAPDFSGREGYRDNFLGNKSALRVPLPALTADQLSRAAPVMGGGNVLRYTHFSIVMNAGRRFAYLTACNIDGSSSTSIRRGDNWRLDPRIAATDQVGDELYRNNDLDRGHLVRRLDPVWGSSDVAKQANDDTFYFTNSTPQHATLNQGNWNDLEEYILSNTNVLDLKVSVYTGPVFADDDPEYRGLLLPQAFWKIVALVNGDTGKLHATAYMLSQRDLISNLEFVFGQFRTYQVPVAEVERRTGLVMAKLRRADPLRDQESFAIREIARLDDIVL